MTDKQDLSEPSSNQPGSGTVEVLGCGTSTGVPVPGCSCAVCGSHNPRNKRLRASVAVRIADTTILIDAGIDLRLQALRANLRRVDSVLYTHGHADHILGLDDLRGFNFVQRKTICGYGTATTLERIRQVFDYVFDPVREHEGSPPAQVNLKEIDDLVPFETEGIAVRPFPLLHGSLRVTGYRIGNFAYATDCNQIPEESFPVLRGVDTLILDGLRYEEHRTHFTIPRAIEIAARIGARQTYLTHMTHTIDYDAVSAKLPSGVALAFDGLSFSLSLSGRTDDSRSARSS